MKQLPAKGQITRKELKQVGYITIEGNRLKRSAPVEAIKGVGAVKGKKLRKYGIKTVGDFRSQKVAGFDPMSIFRKKPKPKPKRKKKVQPPKKATTTVSKTVKQKPPKKYEDLAFFRLSEDSSYGFREPWDDEIIVVREEKKGDKRDLRQVKIKKFNEKRDEDVISTANYQISRGVDARAYTEKTLLQCLREAKTKADNPNYQFRIKKTITKKAIDARTGKPVTHKFHIVQLRKKFKAKRKIKPPKPPKKPKIKDEKSIWNKREVIEVEGLPVKVTSEDISFDLARSAYRNTSWSPEKRAISRQKDYISDMQSMYNSLTKYAKSEEQKAFLNQEFLNWRTKYIQKFHDLLSSHSRIASSAIVGGARFPVQRMRKYNDQYDNKAKAFNDWNDKVQNAIRRKLQKMTPAHEIQMDRDRDLHRSLRTINGTYSKEHWAHKEQGTAGVGYFRGLEKSNLYKRLETLARNGELEELNRQLKIIETEQRDKYKRQFFTKAHKIWRLPLLAKRRQEQEKQAGADGIKSLLKFKGGEVVNNYKIDRTQIIFDEKYLPKDLWLKLKRNGWNRTKNGIYQRKITGNSEYDAKRIVGGL